MTTLLSDDFSDANGTNLDGKSLDVGGTWSALSGAGSSAGTVQDGQAAPEDHSAFVANASDADVEVSFDWTPVPGAENRDNIILRAISYTSMWVVNAREDNGDVRIIEGNTTVRATVAQSFTEGQTYAFKARAEGTTITAYVDGSPVTSYGFASANQSITSHGIGSFNSAGAGSGAGRIDNFLCTDLDAGGGGAGARRRRLIICGSY